jgi:hypothetical protein
VTGAAIGFALAFLLFPRLPWRSSPGQLPGYAARLGFDPRGGELRLVVLVLLSLLGGTVAQRFSGGRFPKGLGGRQPAATGATGATLPRSRPKILVPAAAAHALIAWTFLIVPAARHGFARPFVLLAALAGASLVLCAALGGRRYGEGAAFLGAASATLPLAFLGSGADSRCIAAGAAVYALPVLARVVAPAIPSSMRLWRIAVVAILLPGSVTALSAAAFTRTPRVADVFEDGHALLPASEYLRGHRPYRDVVPGHGFVSDGGLAAAQLRTFGDDYAGFRRGEKAAGALFWPAFYALGWAATGSPGIGFLGMILTFFVEPVYSFQRIVVSVWVLALAVYASRTKKPGAWLACGVALPLGFCVAVEFAVYDAAAVAVALWVARGRRSENLRRLLLGTALSTAAVALLLGFFGILGPFLRATFVFLPALLPVYALGFPRVAVPSDLPALRAGLADGTLLFSVFVALSVVLLGAFLPRAPRVGPRARAFLPVGIWAVFAMLSVLERWHYSYGVFVVPVGLILAVRWVRGGRPWTSPRAWLPAGALAAVMILRQPGLTLYYMAVGIVWPSSPAGAVALDQPARARGALFQSFDAVLVRSAAEAMRRAGFRDGDTWLDFSGAPGLYYLFNRPCPIRYYEVGFYETEAAQREVIAAVERNPHVRLVLMKGYWPFAIDRVPNDVRAPLVAAWIREHFRPFYEEGGIEWWLRKDATGESSPAATTASEERRAAAASSRP